MLSWPDVILLWPYLGICRITNSRERSCCIFPRQSDSYLVLSMKGGMGNKRVWVPALKGRILQCISGLLKVKNSLGIFQFFIIFLIEMSLENREDFELCVCCAVQQQYWELDDTVGGPQPLKHCWPNKYHVWGCSSCATICTDYCMAWLVFWDTKQLIFWGKQREADKSGELRQLNGSLAVTPLEQGGLLEAKLMMFWLGHL